MDDTRTTTEADAAGFARAYGDDDAPTMADMVGADGWFEGPATVETGGIRCGACKNFRHATVDDVRWCYDLRAYYAAEAEAEAAMEARTERWFEEGPDSFQAVLYAEEQYERMRCPNWPL